MMGGGTQSWRLLWRSCGHRCASRRRHCPTQGRIHCQQSDRLLFRARRRLRSVMMMSGGTLSSMRPWLQHAIRRLWRQLPSSHARWRPRVRLARVSWSRCALETKTSAMGADTSLHAGTWATCVRGAQMRSASVAGLVHCDQCSDQRWTQAFAMTVLLLSASLIVPEQHTKVARTAQVR